LGCGIPTGLLLASLISSSSSSCHNLSWKDQISHVLHTHVFFFFFFFFFSPNLKSTHMLSTHM
jgi:hypothetical protein